MKMNMNKMILASAISALMQSASLQTSAAQGVVPAYVYAVGISTNGAGGLSYHTYGNWDIIKGCASEAGLTNLMGLSLVYDPTADALEVVSGTNHTVVCTPMTFNGGTTLSNTNGTKTERLTFVYAEGNTVANGTLDATEYSTPASTNRPGVFILNGKLQYAVPGGTNGPTIYSGSLVAGPRFLPIPIFGGGKPGSFGRQF